jgi:triosephosphate isomerase
MKSLVVGNWKMNPATWREAKKLFEATRKAADTASHVSVVVAPPAIFFRELKAGYKGKKIAFAAQTGLAEATGAHTGEISLAQYKDAGASYAILGHAERRGMGETDEEIGKKVAAALALKLVPILCVGENKRSADGAHFEVVRTQLRAGLMSVEPSQLARIVITYEPLWTIGAERAMNPRDMHEMAIFIRKTIVDLKGPQGMNIKILYGGSIDETNAADMLKNGDVHGFLVGRASEDATKLAALLQALEQAA